MRYRVVTTVAALLLCLGLIACFVPGSVPAATSGEGDRWAALTAVAGCGLLYTGPAGSHGLRAGPFWRWREGEGPQAGKAPRRVSWRERESSTGISRIWAATMQIVSVKRAGSMPNRPLPYMM